MGKPRKCRLGELPRLFRRWVPLLGNYPTMTCTALIKWRLKTLHDQLSKPTKGTRELVKNIYWVPAVCLRNKFRCGGMSLGWSFTSLETGYGKTQAMNHVNKPASSWTWVRVLYHRDLGGEIHIWISFQASWKANARNQVSKDWLEREREMLFG